MEYFLFDLHICPLQFKLQDIEKFYGLHMLGCKT